MPSLRVHPRLDDRLLSLEEVSDFLGLDLTAVRRMVVKGMLPAVRIRGAVGLRVRESDVFALLYPAGPDRERQPGSDDPPSPRAA